MLFFSPLFGQSPQEEKSFEEQSVELAPIQQSTELYESSFIKTLILFSAFLVLIVVTIWMYKKISQGRFRSFNSLKAVKILERRPLSPKSILYLIEVSGKQVLIAESQVEVRTITTVEWQGEDQEL